MDFSDISYVILNSLMYRSPVLAAWIAAIVLSAIMLRRGGGRAERFLLTGSCLMLLGTLLLIPAPLIAPWLLESGVSRVRVASLVGYFGMLPSFVSLAGIVCLVYAFWTKFKVKSNANPQS